MSAHGHSFAAWWGMVLSAVSIVLLVLGLVFDTKQINSILNIGTTSTIAGVLFSVIFLLIYLYFSYQLLLGAQSVSGRPAANHESLIK
jgi:hypothetical protein